MADLLVAALALAGLMVFFVPMYFFGCYLQRASHHIRGKHLFSVNLARIAEPGFYMNLAKALAIFAVIVFAMALVVFSGS